MNRKLFRQFPIVLAIIGLLVPGQFIADARLQPQQGGVSPSLVEAVLLPLEGLILVRGQEFTPGGQVYIALYDRWGVQLFETRWVTATDETLGMNGSRDPALGYLQGGAVFERFGLSEAVFGPNGSRDPALGYIPGTTASSEPSDQFGPDGSRDPAMINEPDDAATERTASPCSATLMVRALDDARGMWTNMLDIEAIC